MFMSVDVRMQQGNSVHQQLQPDIPGNKKYIPEESIFFSTVYIDERAKISPLGPLQFEVNKCLSSSHPKTSNHYPKPVGCGGRDQPWN
jgi:hypothetical protein